MKPLINRPSITYKDLLLFFSIFLLIAVVFRLQQSFDVRGRAKGISANIVIDTSILGEDINTSFYHSFAQGGVETTDMLGPVVNQVKALHPEIIRIDHIFDGYGVVNDSSAGAPYNWSKLDTIVDSILKTGAVPLLSLSYMPPAYAQGGAVIDIPKDWALWQRLVFETIRHFSGTRGIKGVRYEVWNEPDLGQFGGWKYYGDKNYLSLYYYAGLAASQVRGAQQFYLGGPATTSYYVSWIQRLLESGNKVDFVSWHTYDSNPKTIADQVNSFYAFLYSQAIYDTVPVYITEYGHTGDKSPLYGYTYEAAFTASVVRYLLDVPIKPIIFAFELKDAPNDVNGWGMITHESEGAKPKPRYHVFHYLDIMKGKRLSLSGEGTWVNGFATTDGTVFRALLINIDPVVPGGTHVETVPVTFTNLPPGDYSIKRKRFLENEVISTVHSDDGTVTVSIYMPASGMEIIEISPVLL